MRKLSILAAYSKNRVIGYGGQIPWNLPSERDRFKKICRNKFIIMGRKSFEEIGHPLSYCKIIILSKTLTKAPEGCLLARSFDQALNLATQNGEEEILIAGGQEVYTQALPFATTIYATQIQKDFLGDRFFPELNMNEWTVKDEEVHSENGITYKYLTFTRS